MSGQLASTISVDVDDLPEPEEVHQYHLGYRHCLRDLAAMPERDRATLFEFLQAIEE